MKLGRFVVVALGLSLVFSCGGSGGAGGADAGSGGAHDEGGTNSGGASGSGGATGSGGAAADPSGVTGSKALGTLTTAEKGQICDWSAALWGGYNQTKVCPSDSTAKNPTSQADCLSKFPTCTATVSQFEACNRKIAADPCNLIATVLTAPECVPLQSC